MYESKLFWIYDHRYASFEGCSDDEIEKGNPKEVSDNIKEQNYTIMPRFWIQEEFFKKKKENWAWDKEWFLAIRLITGATNQRTCVASIIPNYPNSYSLNLILGISAIQALYLLSVMNSFVFDYITRLKMSGNNLMVHIIEQLIIIDYEVWGRFKDLIIPRCLELLYNSNELTSFAKECGYDGKPFRWDRVRRANLQADLDAIIAFLFKINKAELGYILDTFLVLKKNEIEEFHEFKTKRLILDAYDDFSKQKELFE